MMDFSSSGNQKSLSKSDLQRNEAHHNSFKRTANSFLNDDKTKEDEESQPQVKPLGSQIDIYF